jgi:hypothetical protein
MLKRFSISDHSFKTATILLILAMGVFASRADHFQWENSTRGFSAPSPTYSTDDPVYYYQDGADCLTNNVLTDGSIVYLSAYLQASSVIGTLTPYTAQAINTGHSLSISGHLSDEISGEWVSDEDGPPVDATIDYTAHFTGMAYAETRVWQAINPSDVLV